MKYWTSPFCLDFKNDDIDDSAPWSNSSNAFQARKRIPRRASKSLATVPRLVAGNSLMYYICRGAHEQQIWEVISHEILIFCRNLKDFISKNMAFL